MKNDQENILGFETNIIFPDNFKNKKNPIKIPL